MPANQEVGGNPGNRVSALSNVLPSSIEMRNFPSSVPTYRTPRRRGDSAIAVAPG
jgi:hypothetical protein